MKNVRVRLVYQRVVDVIVTGFDSLTDAIDHVKDQASEGTYIHSGDCTFEPQDHGITDVHAEWTDAEEIE